MPETKVTSVVSGNRDKEQTLVAVFLRGGADGLNLVAPVGDDDYHRARPTIGVRSGSARMLDDFFGLHPLLANLVPLYREGLMSVVHCVGSEDQTRSHFEAQDIMDHGGNVAGGWLGRYLRATQPTDGHRSPLSAVAIGSTLPESLRGAPSASAIRSISDFSLGSNTATVRDLLGELYRTSAPPALQNAGRSAVAALQRIDAMIHTKYLPAHGAEYAGDAFSSGLRQIAQLIKGRVGLEAATIDIGNWDSHLTQSAIMDPQIRWLNAGLSAFCRDLGEDLQRTSIVVMTEFGRRVQENSALGTDHGRGSVMLVLGGGHKGGTIHGRSSWPGLKQDALEEPGDLPVLINYRNVLTPILTHISSDIDLTQVFPDFPLKPLPLFG